MIVPFSLKIGHIALEISTSLDYDTQKLAENDWQDLTSNWRDVKEIIDGQLAKVGQGDDPISRDPKMKLIKEILHNMSDPELDEKNIVEELLKTGKFSEEEAKVYLRGYIPRL